MKYIAKTLPLMAGVFLISGCSTLAIGENEFACTGVPGETICGSATEVYRLTNGDYQAPEATLKVDGKTQPATGNISDQKLNNIESNQHRSNQNNINLPIVQEAVPIRTPAQVMRIWIAPWEDTNGNLHIPGLVYTEIEQRTWTLSDGPDGSGAKTIIHKSRNH